MAMKFRYRLTIFTPMSEIKVLPQCPIYGGELLEKDVQKLLRGGLRFAYSVAIACTLRKQ